MCSMRCGTPTPPPPSPSKCQLTVKQMTGLGCGMPCQLLAFLSLDITVNIWSYPVVFRSVSTCIFTPEYLDQPTAGILHLLFRSANSLRFPVVFRSASTLHFSIVIISVNSCYFSLLYLDLTTAGIFQLFLDLPSAVIFPLCI
jgi:hypothetical protein